MSIFRSFRSTVAPFVQGRKLGGLNLLVDPVTGAPAGIESPNANGPHGIWTPIDLTAAQIASPTAAMIADLNAVFRLNVAPYTRYTSDGTNLVTPASTGAFAQTGTTTFTQPVAETERASFITTTVLSGGNSQDVLNIVGRSWTDTRGFHGTSAHTTAFYGEGLGIDTVAGTSDWENAFVGISGNQGLGIVTNAVDYRGHADLNNGGGALTNHYFLYQEASSGAANEYGGYLSAPLGIGTTAPGFNLDINAGAGGNISAANWLRAGSGTGTLIVTSTGTSLFPGYSPGAGGLGVLDLVVGNNGAAEATTSTGAFLYISSCAGTPTGVPAKGAVGRIAVRYDTTADKFWIYNGSAWKGIAVA